MLENKSILIVGASTGLGKELAIKLANKSPYLAIMARNETALKETAALCATSPLIITGDITFEADCKQAIEKVIETYGRLDHLILNAGISMWSRFDDLEDLSVIKQIMQTNYFGAVHCTHHALSHLKKSKGLITVISSIQGKIGVPYHSGYAASKHALEGFFNSLRIELNQAVDVLLVSPGWIKGTELKRRAWGSPTQVSTNRHAKQALSLNHCTEEIIAAMAKRKRELIVPKKYQIVPLLKYLMPKLLDNLIGRKV